MGCTCAEDDERRKMKHITKEISEERIIIEDIKDLEKNLIEKENSEIRQVKTSEEKIENENNSDTRQTQEITQKKSIIQNDKEENENENGKEIIESNNDIIVDKQEEKNEPKINIEVKEEIKTEEEDEGNELISDASKWREYLRDDNNFSQEIPFDFKTILYKLKKAARSPESLNPFYTISAMFDFTKFFKKISSALSMGFSDIVEKCGIMRTIFAENPDTESIQELLNKELKLDIHKLNGDNNKKLGHKKDQYSKYISACRTFLRLLWFLEYLTDAFEQILQDDGTGEMKKILGNSYYKVLAPHHGFFVKKAVGMALSLSSMGSVSHVIEISLGHKKYNEETRKEIKDAYDSMKIIWKGGYEFYKANSLLDLE